jgi:uncharacterized membrane protein
VTALLMACAIAAALVSGIFYAFSTFVMRALGALSPAVGIAAMQSINIVVINPLFFAVFFGTAGLSLAGAGASRFSESDASAWFAVAGAILYIVGCVGVTIVGNVPLNNRLAGASPEDSDAQSLWRFYLVRWTFWNHVRTAASLAAAVCFVLGVNPG